MMKTMLIAFAVVVSLLSAGPVNSPMVGEATGVPWPPVACGSPCVIEDDGGGIIDLYAAQGRLLAAGHDKLIVDGPCMSACTILVDLDRANVCMTSRALLGYHQSSMIKNGVHVFGPMVYETPGLNAYLESRGGLPTPDSGHMLLLNSVEAERFYKPCV